MYPRYLEAQIQGSKTQAQDGTLVILVAGDRSLFDDCQSCFQVANLVPALAPDANNRVVWR